MIAKFIKFEPTDKGLTIILQTEKSKDHMRELVELMGEDCIIEKADLQVNIKTDRIMAIFDSLIQALREEHDNNKQV